jgi:hypothetical protein
MKLRVLIERALTWMIRVSSELSRPVAVTNFLISKVFSPSKYSRMLCRFGDSGNVFSAAFYSSSDVVAQSS